MAVCATTRRDQEGRELVLDFVREEVLPRIPRMEQSSQVDYDLPRLMAQMKWTSPSYGPEYGGLGLGQRWKVMMLATLAEFSGATSAVAQAGIIPTDAIVHHGNEEQKREWLERIACGDCIPAISVTEPGAGGDLLEIQTTAERVGETYVLNGAKDCVGNALPASMHVVIARTGPRELRSRSLSAFIVETDRPGFSYGRHVPLTGLRAFSCDEVRFDNCRIPAVNRLGEEGDGLLVAHTASLLAGRLNIAAMGLGLQQAACDAAYAALQKSERHKQHQVLQLRLGEMLSRLDESADLLLAAADLLDQGHPCDAKLVNAKKINVKNAIESTWDAILSGGARALKVTSPCERYNRDARCIEFPAGPEDFQRHRLFQLAGSTRKQLSERYPSPLVGRLQTAAAV
jgi:alkylation response protein AidB-like acyl-CoA dehydrogenase